MKNTLHSLGRATLAGIAALALGTGLASAQTAGTKVTIDLNQPGNAISPDLFGIFFEDINYAADGGLYAELVQNRSFEYQATEQLEWTPMTSWEFTTRNDGRGGIRIADAVPVHPNNPHYAVVDVQQPGGGVGLVNSGFDGFAVQAGAHYDFSIFARQLYTGNRWGGNKTLGEPAQLSVRLETKAGEVVAETTLKISGRDWQQAAAVLTATKSDASARLAVLVQTKGAVAMDEISLFPRETFKHRANGLRADLAQSIADLHPKFVRFPGGCLVHGHGLGNMYRWKDSIGPVEQRRGQPNLWGYHQSLGLGYFEYFQFCEDIGAKPLPVVPAAVCCQNADNQGGTGQRGLPMEEMPAYIQDVLDLIEWANGPTNSTWGAKRAAAGHPAPFRLQYLGVGNEENITPAFEERFKMIYNAVKAKHPEITVIGTAGPFHSGEDFDAGWKIVNELQLPMVDEHYYESPDWFLSNLQRYDRYDREKAKVYLGEYASRGNSLFNALAEAAYMTALERNGDVVHMASYAPLLARLGHTQWNPDMIYFNNTEIMRTANYHVQQLFGQNSGDRHFPAEISPETAGLSFSCVQDSKTGDFILKLVNVSTSAIAAQVNFPPFLSVQPKAVRTVLTGNPKASNSFAKPDLIRPESSEITVGKSFTCEAPAGSLSVIRIKTR
jgi:alpha-L-arabinofuranosidase